LSQKESGGSEWGQMSPADSEGFGGSELGQMSPAESDSVRDSLGESYCQGNQRGESGKLMVFSGINENQKESMSVGFQ
jgi:hypothetical protein